MLYRIVDKNVEVVHSARLLPYRADMENTIVSEHLMRHTEHSEAKYEEIHCLWELAEGERGIVVLTEWKGLPDKCNFTWQPLKERHEDIPEALEIYLSESKQHALVGMARKARKQL